MSSKKTKKRDLFSKMRKQCLHILMDIVFLYKNFIHWNISKILISIWTMVLGIMVAAPVFVLAVLIWFIDPINWGELVQFILSWSDISYNIINKIAAHPYWLVLMLFVLVVGVFLFLLASSYSLFLHSNLALHYLKWKKLWFKKNLYFSRRFVVTFMSIICWNIMYLLAPIIIWVGVIFFIYLFYNIGFIWFQTLSNLIAIITVILILSIVYLVYRIMFGYVYLVKDHKKKKLHSGKSYLLESVKNTKGKSFWKFLFVSILFTLMLIPFTRFDSYLETESVYLKDTIRYNSGLVETLEPEQIPYYEYVTAEYSDMTNDEIMSRINSFFTLRIILFFMMYFVIEWLFIYIINSFYLRVLKK